VEDFHGRRLAICLNEEGLFNYSPIDMVVTLQTVNVALENNISTHITSTDLKIKKKINFKFAVKLRTSSLRYNKEVDSGSCTVCFPVHFRPSGRFPQ
jgi:hypothetical protein